MSGFEIAGAVLGGFPILLNCIDYYRGALEPMDNWWHFRKYLIEFVDDIRHQNMRYHDNLIRLLDPIIPDNESLVNLIRDPTDFRWKDGSLEDHLKDRFPSELDRFLRTIERMHDVMLELYKILQIRDGKKIENLCAFLEETSWNEGVLHDEFDRHLVFNKDSSGLRRIVPGKLRLLSLTELLEAHHQADITLSRQSRFEIAAHISAALLNTYPSPWMPSSWTKSSFYFLVDDETLLSCHPFLSNTFELDKEESSLSEESTSPKNISEQTARNYLFTVGVIVLELIFGHDIGHCRFRKDYLQDNRPNELTDMLTAQRWAKKVLGESGPNIADVVRRCLDCSFGPRPVLSDVRFRESIYEGVIKPLASYAKIWPEVMV
ncbi:uncharacterized protein CCOS01_13331 [Colletotrichum costaricense]|uniref:DUF7580 domain-containing protein n=1 Tax=Colletotrichum costaricense TaxID=1209916 RepID=A0AAJ0DVL2_9PEZI|nr:uncharacterized protein CCOS01_13331 [Colletotrichum costaricense]KAK1515138.1 hypothetical protein CCOS01_13331 [Colletotrichum costaricense]